MNDIGRYFPWFLTAFAVIVLAAASLAWADPAAIDKAKSQASALRDQIDELDQRVEAAVEEYNTANAQLEDTKAAAKQNQAKLTKAEADLEEAGARLETRLVEIYKNGHLGVLSALVGSASFSDVINRLQLMERLSAQDSRLVEQVQEYRGEVTTRKAALARQLEEEKQYAAQAGAAERKIKAQLAAKKKSLAGKEAQIAQLEKEEAARQAALAAAAKKAAERAAQEAARKAKEAAARRARPSASTENPVKEGTRAELVQYSMRFLGIPYVWGGYSTSGFDCSGFTKYVFAHFGINIPHSSKMQFRLGRPVSRADLRPGDLLFFYSPISHVGLYIGNGKMINARSGGVRIDNAFWGSYVGARSILD